jgi:hypothetical protein
MARYDVLIAEDPEPYRREIVEFWGQNLPHYGTERRFDWLHHCNPSGPPLTALAFVQGDNRIIGCGSMYPWACRVEGVAKTLWFSSHFAVSIDHRVFGPAFAIQKKLARTLADRGEPLAFGYPNKASAGTLKVAGYRHIGASHNWVRILDWRGVIRRRLPVPVLGRIAELTVKVVDVAALGWFRRSCRAYTSEFMERCDSRIDDLWQRTTECSAFQLARTSAVLNWRYADNPDVRYRFFAIRAESSPRDAIDAELVFTRQGRSVTIKDVFPASPQTAIPLLSRFLDAMAGDGVELVTVCHWGDSRFRDLLRRMFFLERPDFRDYYFRNAAEVPGQSGKLLAKSGDVSLFFG